VTSKLCGFRAGLNARSRAAVILERGYRRNAAGRRGGFGRLEDFGTGEILSSTLLTKRSCVDFRVSDARAGSITRLSGSTSATVSAPKQT